MLMRRSSLFAGLVVLVACALATPAWGAIDSATYGTKVMTWEALCNPAAPEVAPGTLPACPGPSITITLPTDLMATTAFWEGNAAYVLGGVNEWHSPTVPTETDAVLKFTRGMQVGVLPVYEPNQPGGLVVGAGALPAPAANQALAYDATGKVAYLFGSSNEGRLSDAIYSYSPLTQTSATMPCVLPRKFDLMAGAWASGKAYLFGGRYLEGNGDTVAFSLHNSNEIYRFDPATCAFNLNPYPLATVAGASGTAEGKRFGMTAVTVGAEVFLFGGTFMDDVAGTTPAEVGGGAYAYNPVCPTGAPPYAPCPVAQCSILKFIPATGATTVLLSSSALCGPLAAVYDGQFIYAFTGSSAYRYNPATPSSPPVYVAALATGVGRGGLSATSAVSTGCSAYIFGGLIRPPPFLPDPAALMGDPYDRALISDKIQWFGKCRPQAVIAPTYGYTCPNYPIWFDAKLSTVGEGDIMQAAWTFGDGTSIPYSWWFAHPPDWYPQAAFVSHTYTKEGNFPVTLSIRDANGLVSTASVVVPVRQDPVCTTFGGTPHVARALRYPEGVALDSDLDGIPDGGDNCPGIANNAQGDRDGNGVGDDCDETAMQGDGGPPAAPSSTPAAPDRDRDGVPDAADNCAAVPNHDQADADIDRNGDVCDADIDGDGVSNAGPPGAFLDNCPWYANVDQADQDLDGAGDECSFGAMPALARDAGEVHASAARTSGSPPWLAAFTVAAVATLGCAALLGLALRRPGGRRP